MIFLLSGTFLFRQIYQLVFRYRRGYTEITISIYTFVISFDIPIAHNLHSVHSADEEPAPQPKRARLGTDVTETAKDGTVWHEEQLGKEVHFTPIEAYATDGEPTAKAKRSITSRLQSFLCFITLDMLRIIQQWTIQHAQQTEHVDWFMALPELMAFLAIVILRGLTKTPSLPGCWSANLGNPHIIGIMSRNRFKNIMQNLRFDDKSTRDDRGKTDKFAAISDNISAVFYNMIDMAALNAHVLYQACTGKQERRVNFLVELARELAHSHVGAKKAQKEEQLRQQPSTPSPRKRAMCQVKDQCKNNHATVRCNNCYRYTCGKCRQEVPWQCRDCE